MEVQNMIRNGEKLKLNREDFCQSCEVGICIKNCKNCLFNVLCDYKPRELRTPWLNGLFEKYKHEN